MVRGYGIPIGQVTVIPLLRVSTTLSALFATFHFGSTYYAGVSAFVRFVAFAALDRSSLSGILSYPAKVSDLQSLTLDLEPVSSHAGCYTLTRDRGKNSAIPFASDQEAPNS
jgi:hypothetical protein